MEYCVPIGVQLLKVKTQGSEKMRKLPGEIREGSKGLVMMAGPRRIRHPADRAVGERLPGGK
jgi:hypothetical protein